MVCFVCFSLNFLKSILLYSVGDNHCSFSQLEKDKMFRSKGQRNICFWSKGYAIRRVFGRKIIDRL